MRAIVLRCGDFFGGGRGSWFDLVVLKEFHKDRLTYPGPPDIMHEWAYVPDVAATLVKLADTRGTLAPFETFGFPGHAITGGQLIAAIEAATGRRFNVREMSWWFLKTFGRLLTLGRELVELEYLWRVPHRISGDRLRSVLGEVPHTPLPKAVAAAMRELGYGPQLAAQNRR
jgi:nucleoside-diphosphate-sugar epimerase